MTQTLHTKMGGEDLLHVLYRGADKYLARPGRKQATATKLLQATQKNSESYPSN